MHKQSFNCIFSHLQRAKIIILIYFLKQIVYLNDIFLDEFDLSPICKPSCFSFLILILQKNYS